MLAATWHTVRHLGLEPALFEEFLTSMRMDITVNRYATWEDLRGYMRGSAAVIGEMMAPLLGAAGPDALRRAGLLGEAFQLTNFIRDVAEDLDRGRIYLPLEDLERFGVSEDELRLRPHQRAALTGGAAAAGLRGATGAGALRGRPARAWPWWTPEAVPAWRRRSCSTARSSRRWSRPTTTSSPDG